MLEMKNKYSLQKGNLHIIDTENGEIIYHDKVMGYSAKKLLVHIKGDYCVVLFPPEEGPTIYDGGGKKAFNNLVCVDSVGKVIWIAELPASGLDYYVNVLWSNEISPDFFSAPFELEKCEIVGISYCGVLVVLNDNTGKIQKSLLIK